MSIILQTVSLCNARSVFHFVLLFCTIYKIITLTLFTEITLFKKRKEITVSSQHKMCSMTKVFVLVTDMCKQLTQHINYFNIKKTTYKRNILYYTCTMYNLYMHLNKNISDRWTILHLVVIWNCIDHMYSFLKKY